MIDFKNKTAGVAGGCVRGSSGILLRNAMKQKIQRMTRPQGTPQKKIRSLLNGF